jgi:hypothetical protein
MGKLPVPKIRIEGVPEGRIVNGSNSCQIVVHPNPLFVSPVIFTELT